MKQEKVQVERLQDKTVRCDHCAKIQQQLDAHKQDRKNELKMKDIEST